jgi:predicted transcriptional regulator
MDENPWRKRRHELGLSAKELSEKTGLCMESIYRAETGQVQPTKVTVAKLEVGLGMR